MDQGVIRAFKVYYRRHLVKHIITSAGVAVTADDINITALDVVYWIQGACEAVSETTIRTHSNQPVLKSYEIISAEDKSIEELDRVLRHLTIVFPSTDDNAPSFNDWTDSNDKLLVINGIINDDGDSNEDQLNDDVPSEDPPSLSEFL
ncbi:unnamed protein product, partial [Rotaria magnacalcarata]